MPIRNLSEIFVPENRIRKTFPEREMEELIDSILSKGLLHPPVVEADGALLAGERRFRAITEIANRGLDHVCNRKSLRPGLIYTTDIRDFLSPGDRLEAELEENTIRLDITWQDKAQAVERLHELRQIQKNEAAVATDNLPTEQTLRETAAEIRGVAPEAVNRDEIAWTEADLAVAVWMKHHPDDTEVSGAKTRAEALKIMGTRLEDERRQALAKKFLVRRETIGGGHILEHGNMNEILRKTPDNIYDVIVADPPWGVSADLWQNQGALRGHTYLDDLRTSDEIYETLAVEGFRVGKPRCHAYIFVASHKFEDIAKRLRSVGWDVWPRPLIWYRGSNSGIAPRPEHGPRNTYECILFANKGNKRVIQLLPDVLLVPNPGEIERAAAKPPLLYWDLLRRSVIPGDEVLDPCCGSGPIFPAANALKVRATGYDVDDAAIGLASRQLKIELKPTTYFITPTRNDARVSAKGKEKTDAK